jgi:hypothetical protein
MNKTMMNPNAWEEVIPDLYNGLDQRSPTNYIAAAKQYEVETNPRYVRGHANPGVGRETYCNIYLWDVTVAMKCEVAHWVDPATGVETPRGKGIELSANGVVDWFTTHSMKFGWMQCDKSKAMARASGGHPSVVLWKNPGGIGHVAVVLPGLDFCHIAQAGGSNFFDQNLTKGFGNIPNLLFFTHD